MFALPLFAGAARVGVLALYSRSRTVLSEVARDELDVCARLAVGLLLDDTARVDRPVHQATGMVSAQLGVDVDEALVRLRAHAFAQGRPVFEIAHEVVTHRLRFPPNDPGTPATRARN